MDLLWSKVYDVIIKALIAGEHPVITGMKWNCSYWTNCFELFGFDILLDSDLKPWLLEINLSPSLACESPLDTMIKTKLISDTFNLVGIKKFDWKKESIIKQKNWMKGSYRTKTGNINQTPIQSSKGSSASTAASSSKEEDLYDPPCKDLEKLIRELWDSQESKEMLCWLSRVKHRDIL